MKPIKSIRTRLILTFFAATVIPVAATLWIATTLLDQSLSFSTTEQLDRLSKSLQDTGRQYFQQAQELLRHEAQSGLASPMAFALARRVEWSPDVAEFWQSGEAEQFAIAGDQGSRIQYYVRMPGGVALYSRDLGVRMEDLSTSYRSARKAVQMTEEHDLHQGFTRALVVLVVAVWVVALVWLVYVSNRISRPVRRLSDGLAALAAGRLETRIAVESDDEVGRAVAAFNHCAAELQTNQSRLVYLTQMASWQVLARKMAHELKNALTPIRLTVEEIRARRPIGDEAFMDCAVPIIVSEIEALERRVRAFSEFSSEPPVKTATIDAAAVLEERIAFLKTAHPDATYTLAIPRDLPSVLADADRMKGILTNLLENAAEAAGTGGRILARADSRNGAVEIEIHDSGPGLSPEARQTLFEPTISFKLNGMGLGLSIARKDALVCGGDLAEVAGRLGGAGFRLTLPRAPISPMAQ